MPDRYHCRDDLGLGQATETQAVTIVSCDHGRVFVRLHGRDEGVIAFAALADMEEAATLFRRAAAFCAELATGLGGIPAEAGTS